MTVEFAVVRSTIPTTSTTKSFESSGFGTPQAAIILGGYSDSADGTWYTPDNTNHCIGYTDGTTHRASAIHWKDTSGTVETGRRSANTCFLQCNEDGNESKRGDFDSWATNGITLDFTLTVGTADMDIIVILIKGADDVQVGSLTSNTTQNGTASVTGMASQPDLVFMSMVGANSHPFNGVAGLISAGIAIDNGVGIDQRMTCVGNQDAQAAVVMTQILNDDNMVGQAYADSNPWNGELTAFNSDGFTMTTRDGSSGGDVTFYLAVDTGGAELTLETLSSPSGTTPAVVESSATSEYPAFAMCVFTKLNNANTLGTTKIANGFSTGVAERHKALQHMLAFHDNDAESKSVATTVVDDAILATGTEAAGAWSDHEKADLLWRQRGVGINFTTTDTAVDIGFLLQVQDNTTQHTATANDEYLLDSTSGDELLLDRTSGDALLLVPPAGGATGSGTPSLGSLTTSGAGKLTCQGSGTPSLGGLACSGAGELTLNSTGAVTLGGLAAAGSGNVGVPAPDYTPVRIRRSQGGWR